MVTEEILLFVALILMLCGVFIESYGIIQIGDKNAAEPVVTSCFYFSYTCIFTLMAFSYLRIRMVFFKHRDTYTLSSILLRHVDGRAFGFCYQIIY